MDEKSNKKLTRTDKKHNSKTLAYFEQKQRVSNNDIRRQKIKPILRTKMTTEKKIHEDELSIWNNHFEVERKESEYSSEKQSNYYRGKTTSLKRIPVNNLPSSNFNMLHLHKKSSHKFTQMEMLKYYSKEAKSKKRFSRVLDLKKDRQLLKTLFPINSDPDNDRITDQLNVRFHVKHEKLIYITKRNSVNNARKFAKDNCNVKKCRFTFAAEDLPQADAVLDMSRTFNGELNPHQIHIAYLLESAMNYEMIVYYKDAVNWTATYRRDSVLSSPYGRFTPYTNVTKLPTIPKRNFAKGKKKLIAWFVTNCDTINDRMGYVRAMQEFILLDIFGPCGELKCLKANSADCFQMLKTDYKFYLAFENSNCKDYVTEKMFTNGLR